MSTDAFGTCSQRILEMKRKRDNISQECMEERLQMTQLDEQITVLTIEKNQIKMALTEKDSQVTKYDDLIS